MSAVDQAADLVPFGDGTVLLLGAFFAAFLVIIQTFVYVAHLCRMYYIKDDPHGEDGMKEKDPERNSNTGNTYCSCLHKLCLREESVEDHKQKCCAWHPPFVAMSETTWTENSTDYSIAGNMFDENLRISPTMSEFSTNSMRGNQTLLAVCIATSVALSLLIGFNRLLLTWQIDNVESRLHILVSLSCMSLVLVGLFPSSSIHEIARAENTVVRAEGDRGVRESQFKAATDKSTIPKSQFGSGSSDTQRLVFVKRRGYNMILCCGCNWISASAILHVIGSLVYLCVPVVVKIYVNRDGGSRCYYSRTVFLNMLYAAAVINGIFLLGACCAPAGLCGPMLSGFSRWCAAKCSNCCASVTNCFKFLDIFWNPTGRGCCHKFCTKEKSTKDQLQSTRKRRKGFLMSVFGTEMVAFFVTSAVYFIIEIWTFYHYSSDRFITPKFVST